MGSIGVATASRPDWTGHASARTPRRTALVVLVQDGAPQHGPIHALCDFLDVQVICIGSDADLMSILQDRKPMAVIAGIDGSGQDGFHVMMTVAQHDRTVPFLLLTGDDPALAGAADAIEEVWGLTSMVKLPELPGPAALVDFLFRAGRQGRCLGLIPT